MDRINEDCIGREVYSKGSWTPEDSHYTLKFCSNDGTKKLAWFETPELLSQILLPEQQRDLFKKYGNYILIYNGFMSAWMEDKKRE